MKIAVLGTGMVGQALAGRLASLGHDTTVGTRDPAATMARTQPDAMGNPPYAAWSAEHPAVSLATFADAASRAELVVHAGNGEGALDLLRQAGSANLAGKVLMDVAQPLDFSAGFPPTMFVCNTDSLGEQIQREFPEARVVKTLNTMNASVMVDPASLGSESTVFVSGDDADAKTAVTSLLEGFGHTDVIDLGDISTARGSEMLIVAWLRLMGSLGTVQFNWKVVR
jgi:predicted dinucleotide-binding enzyme